MDWLTALRSLWSEFSAPPEWGVSDCCQFASRYVQLRTGVDHASKFTYHDKNSALRLLAQHNGMVGLISACIGAPVEREPVAGDLVVVNIGIDGEVLSTGVFNGHYVIFIHPDIGLARVFRCPICAVWSI